MTSDDTGEPVDSPRQPSRQGDEVTVSTRREFESMLGDLILAAESNGVEVRGGATVARRDDGSAWNVEITRVVRGPTTLSRDGEPD